jgi:transposase
VEEKLLIFITIASTGLSNRRIQEQFNRGAHTISQ